MEDTKIAIVQQTKRIMKFFNQEDSLTKMWVKSILDLIYRRGKLDGMAEASSIIDEAWSEYDRSFTKTLKTKLESSHDKS